MEKNRSLESDTYKAEFLESNGWKKRLDRRGPWQWMLPKFPGALYTLDHAYDIEKSAKLA